MDDVDVYAYDVEVDDVYDMALDGVYVNYGYMYDVAVDDVDAEMDVHDMDVDVDGCLHVNVELVWVK